MTKNWDKEAVKRLVALGLTHEQARLTLGEIAEQRQIADLEGYKRGYENGYKRGEEDCTQ